MNLLIGISLIIIGIIFYKLFKNKENYEKSKNDKSIYSKSQNFNGYIFVIVLILAGFIILLKIFD